jgi:hypothetical protein
MSRRILQIVIFFSINYAHFFTNTYEFDYLYEQTVIFAGHILIFHSYSYAIVEPSKEATMKATKTLTTFYTGSPWHVCYELRGGWRSRIWREDVDAPGLTEWETILDYPALWTARAVHIAECAWLGYEPEAV